MSLRYDRLRQLKGPTSVGGPSVITGMFDKLPANQLFQVLMIVDDYNMNATELDSLLALHGQSASPMCDLPPLEHGRAKEISTRNGYIFKGDTPESSQMMRQTAYVLFSSDNYKLPNFDGPTTKHPQLIDDLNSVAGRYIPKISKAHPSLNFTDNAALCNTLGYGIEFKFALQPHNPSLYQEGTLGILQPITCLPGRNIIPNKRGFSLTSQKQPCAIAKKYG